MKKTYFTFLIFLLIPVLFLYGCTSGKINDEKTSAGEDGQKIIQESISAEETEENEASNITEDGQAITESENTEAYDSTQKPDSTKEPEIAAEPENTGFFESEEKDPEMDTPEKNSCFLSVSCKAAFENGESASENLLSSLPENGIILSETEIEFTEGDSAFDVLYKALKERGIHFEYSKAPLYNSVYIEGIANLYEFDLGELSGWLYRVNGDFPAFGCSEYYVKPDDRIEFLYTCSRGKDLSTEIN